jgi:hypothetical protein
MENNPLISPKNKVIISNDERLLKIDTTAADPQKGTTADPQKGTTADPQDGTTADPQDGTISKPPNSAKTDTDEDTSKKLPLEVPDLSLTKTSQLIIGSTNGKEIPYEINVTKFNFDNTEINKEDIQTIKINDNNNKLVINFNDFGTKKLKEISKLIDKQAKETSPINDRGSISPVAGGAKKSRRVKRRGSGSSLRHKKRPTTRRRPRRRL